MAQNITLLGASYSDVPAVTLPKTGGGTAQFDDTTDANATASDITSGKTAYVNGVKLTGTSSGGGGDITVESLSVTQNGTYTAPTGKAYSPVTVSVSGGASNVVTGTFTGTTTGAAMDVTLNYTGSGYPIIAVVYPSEGTYNSNGTFYSVIQRYAVNFCAVVKNVLTSAPTYNTTGTENNYAVTVRYKNSSSSNTTYSNNTSGTAQNVATGEDAANGVANVIKFKSATKMSVFIAGTSYGFAANIEYKYWVLYSS